MASFVLNSCWHFAVLALAPSRHCRKAVFRDFAVRGIVELSEAGWLRGPVARSRRASRSIALVGKWIEAGGLCICATAAGTTSKAAASTTAEAAVDSENGKHDCDYEGDYDRPSGYVSFDQGAGRNEAGWIMMLMSWKTGDDRTYLQYALLMHQFQP